MSTATAPRKRSRTAREGRSKSEVRDALAGLPLVGELVTWDSAPTTRDRLLAALKAAGLPEEAAQGVTAQSAFARAARAVEESKEVELVKDHGDELVYQVTAKVKVPGTDGEDEEIDYRRETFVRLHKATGRVTSKRKAVAEWFQGRLDAALEARTASDVTQTVQRLFHTADVDLLPWRKAGGAYLVFADHLPFVDQVDLFLTRVGGTLNRLPVPKGSPKAEKAVGNVVKEAVAELLAEHRLAIDGLDVNSRRTSVEAAAARIKETRVKVEAYRHYLAEKAAEMEGGLDELQKHLQAKVAELAEEKKNAPPKPGEARPGVVNEIFRVLRGASAKAPLSRAAILEHLAKTFPERDAEQMKSTVSTQIGRGLKGGVPGVLVHRNDQGYWAADSE